MEQSHLWAAPPLPFREAEILRYAGLPARAELPEGMPLQACLAEAEQVIRCRGVWREYAVCAAGDALDLGFARLESRSLSRFLRDCSGVILFAVTAGWESERFVARCQLRSPLQGLLAHAIGAERVESACDALCAELSRLYPGRVTRQRFSPGYGDVPLALQREIFAALKCERHLGLTLRENCLMSPARSVTALVGLRSPEGGNPA